MKTRKDITIAIVKLQNEQIVIMTAQGSAQEAIKDEGEILDIESGLYYSQIPHRCAVLHDTNYYIDKPGFAKKMYNQPGEKIVMFPLPIGGGRTKQNIF